MSFLVVVCLGGRFMIGDVDGCAGGRVMLGMILAI